MILRYLFLIVCAFMAENMQAQVWKHVDPRIGSEGLGRVFIGPTMPYGMIKPGPDCTSMPNAGWAPMPEGVIGFTQVHVSGTGGGQKYGNILLQPFKGALNGTRHEQKRATETIELGRYMTTYTSGVSAEFTTADRYSIYRFRYPEGEKSNLLIDCGWFLGYHPEPDRREAQQFVGSEIELIGDREVRGYTRIRGGWNDGTAYTVYFCMQTDVPFSEYRTWKDGTLSNDRAQTDEGKMTGALLGFGTSREVNVKIGISFVSALKAKQNIGSNNLETQLDSLRQSWERLLSRISVKGDKQQLRMFYTALYHTMIMPVDRTGENPLWNEKPYYDDYYAIWDTYRTSSPLITLIDEPRQRDIINALLNIYKRDGYLPDARSGNCNGRTQGGSNAEVVIADAYVKGVKGVDYELALSAMLKDALVPPGGNEEKEGRGGLTYYNTLGYIPYGVDRAGNRTIEYAYDDYCIALVAQGLGRSDVAERFFRQSNNWKNLWRSDYEWDGMRGFIMPKSADGEWMDSVPWGKSKVFTPKIPYTPVTKVAPWYLPWWSTFFYEALSEEYSLSIPHDVPGLIEACGGKDQFQKRLDLFFQKGYYNVANEPSFLTPCLYHWIDRPDLSSARIHQIIRDNYDDTPKGLPGNDDSGAMSSWYAFCVMGIYPNAGQDYYILNAPILKEYTINLSNGNRLSARTEGKGDGFDYVVFNGRRLDKPFIKHAELTKGGEIVFHLKQNKHDLAPAPEKKKAMKWGKIEAKPYFPALETPLKTTKYAYTLNRQFRTWDATFAWDADTLCLRLKDAIYRIPHSEVEHATAFCWNIPADGAIYHDVKGTFGFVSHDALRRLQAEGAFVYDGITWRMIEKSDSSVRVRADIDRTEMTISLRDSLPIVTEMRGNPLGIDWHTED